MKQLILVFSILFFMDTDYAVAHEQSYMHSHMTDPQDEDEFMEYEDLLFDIPDLQV